MKYYKVKAVIVEKDRTWKNTWKYKSISEMSRGFSQINADLMRLKEKGEVVRFDLEADF